MKSETLSLRPLPDYDTRAVRIANEILARADRFDIAGTVFNMRNYCTLSSRLPFFAEEHGPLRILLWPDAGRTSPDAIAMVLALNGVQVAFGRGEPQFGTTDFLISDGNEFTVLASSLRQLYPELCADIDGGGMADHPLPDFDDDARRIIARFEECWSAAQLVDDERLAEFRAKAEACQPQYKVGDLVRSTNDLYKHYGVGRIQKIKNGCAKVEFNPSVFMEPPYHSENKFLRLHEMERVDSPLERACRGQWEEAWRFELKMLAARFLTGNKGGQLSNARTEILPHQIFAAYRVVSSPRCRFLLADEVGLGKTVEAGMIWQALEQRGQTKRTLIITPAGLTTQWQEELQDKFGTWFEIFGRDFTGVNPLVWEYKAKAIASIDTLKRPAHKRLLLESRKWDLIIFDEAHRLSAMDYASGKTEKTLNYRLAEEIRDKQYCDALLLLTATPHQGEENNSRFKNLLRLLEDEIDFTGLDEADLFSGRGKRFTEMVIRTPKKDVTDAQGRKVFKGRQTHRMHVKMNDDEARFYKAVVEYIRHGYKMLDRLADPNHRRAAGFLLTTFQKLNASSTAAIKAALTGRLQRLRGELENLPDSEEEEDDLLYDERYEGEREEESVLKDDREILQGEVDTLEELIGMRVKRDRKLDELLGLIDHITGESRRGEREKVLVFTEYRQTQRHLVEELEKKYGKGCAVVIHGSMKLERHEDYQQEPDTLWAPFGRDGATATPSTKRTSQRLFRVHDRVRFLVSTEAGGEGINLQFCHICVNYDLPWNPMRVEQRVGRVYRYGQDKVVQVYNFFNKDTVEDLVQSYFEDRVTRAAKAISQVTGEDSEELRAALNGQLESEIEPAKIYQRAMVEGDLNRQTQKEIAEAVERARQAYEIATQSLFRDVSCYSFDKYRRELATDLTLGDLQRFSEQFLAAHRRQVQRKEPFLEFLVPDVLKPFKLPERYRNATFDRDLAIRRTDADFLALGHPLIDAMLAYVGSLDFGGLAACRRVKSRKFTGQAGYLFLFVVRQRITHEHGDECLFKLTPVFVTAEGRIDDETASEAVAISGEDAREQSDLPDPTNAFQAAKQHLETVADLWNWEDDVEFLGMSWTVIE